MHCYRGPQQCSVVSLTPTSVATETTKTRGRADLRRGPGFCFGRVQFTVTTAQLGGYIQQTVEFKEFKGKVCAGGDNLGTAGPELTFKTTGLFKVAGCVWIPAGVSVWRRHTEAI